MKKKNFVRYGKKKLEQFLLTEKVFSERKIKTRYRSKIINFFVTYSIYT